MAGHSSSNFVCRICKDIFDCQTLLDQHFLDLHPTKTSHHCNICNEDFISELFLQIHETEYHSTPTRRLKQHSKSQIETKNHIRNISTKSKKFNNFGYLQNKISNALAKTNDSLFWCPVCFESFSKGEYLRGHFRSSHTFASGSVYVCELCDIEKPSAEMLCWHLQVHSNNKLSVNRFSKLRTCLSSTKKEDTENFKQLPEIDLNLTMDSEVAVKTETKLNDLKRLKQKEDLYIGHSSTQETRLKSNIPKNEKTRFWEKTAGRLKLLNRKLQQKLVSQFKLKSLGRSKLNCLPSKKSVLEVNTIITPDDKMKYVDESEGNHLKKSISGPTTKITKDKLLHKLKGNNGKNDKKQKRCYRTKSKNRVSKSNVTIHYQRSDEDNERSKGFVEGVLISNKLFCEGNTSLKDESTKNTIESTGKAVTPSRVRVLKDETRNVCIQNESNAHFPFKDDCQCPYKGKTVELPVDSQEVGEEKVSSDLNKSDTSFDDTEKQSFVFKNISSKTEKSRFRHSRSLNIQEAAECEVKIISRSANSNYGEISSKIQAKVTKCHLKNESQKTAGNESINFEVEVPHTMTTDKKALNERCVDDFENMSQTTIVNNSKDSTTFHFEEKECNKNTIHLKAMIHDIPKEAKSIDFESNSSEKRVFCDATESVSDTSSKKLDSLKILKERCVRKPEKSISVEDLQVTACEREVTLQSESVMFVNSLQDQNDKPIDDGSSTLTGVVPESTSLKSKGKKENQNTDDSKNKLDELFEEISCDKCSLKFYNQDDLFDHLGSHYDF